MGLDGSGRLWPKSLEIQGIQNSDARASTPLNAIRRSAPAKFDARKSLIKKPNWLRIYTSYTVSYTLLGV